MINRLQPLGPEQVQTLHASCMDILSSVGVRFRDAEAIEIFKAHGFKLDGDIVFFTEDQVMEALKTVPSEFTIHARNPEKSVTMGKDHFGLGPGWGAPFIVDADGTKRTASMADQENFCKLVQTSPYLDFAAGSMAVPAELSPTAATAAMLGAAFTLTDMAVISNP
ncbi:MAG: trimethylamine methyltransferase family protein, partial [Desulfovibrionales bacterium]|nr:trimethylamine methyltransferase family protein [Desulfovibrionales bacterium]